MSGSFLLIKHKQHDQCNSTPKQMTLMNQFWVNQKNTVQPVIPGLNDSYEQFFWVNQTFKNQSERSRLLKSFN